MPAVASQLSLFEDRTHTPTWDDVHASRALLVDRIVPCYHCYTHWHDGRCWNTPDRFGYPMNQGDGTCRRHFIVWPEDVRDTDVVR